MAYLTANGTTCTKALVRIPRIGAWTADLVIDDTDPDSYSGQVTLGINSNQIQMTGTTSRYDVQYGVVMTRVVGGGGGLAEILEPKAYQNTSLKVILGDICSAAGETLSNVCDPPTLATGFPFWNRFAMTAGCAIQSALESLGVPWRMRLDGTLYVGPETYPTSKMTNFQVLNQMPTEAAIEFYSDTPSVLPGELLQGRPVSRVEHHFSGENMSSHLWFEVVDP